jgi:hypothetical protein
MQDELPVIPLHNEQLKVNFPAEVHSVTRVSDGTTVDYKYEQGILSLTIPQIHYGEFFHINKKEQI